MNAIPTKAFGVQFRSRLEARWAWMFEMLLWPWHYEPLDLKGYIPDFILAFPDRPRRPGGREDSVGPVLVEVKPELTVPDLIAATAPKIMASGWAGHALMVGADVDLPPDPGLDHPEQLIQFGATWSDWEYLRREGMDPTAQEAYAHACLGSPSHWGFCGASGSTCFHCGATSRRYHGRGAQLLRAMWTQAGNEVQWRPPERREEPPVEKRLRRRRRGGARHEETLRRGLADLRASEARGREPKSPHPCDPSLAARAEAQAIVASEDPRARFALMEMIRAETKRAGIPLFRADRLVRNWYRQHDPDAFLGIGFVEWPASTLTRAIAILKAQPDAAVTA